MTAVQPMTARVVAHPANAAVPARSSFRAKLGRVARGIATAPRELRDWRLVTEMDPDIRAAQDTGQTHIVGALRTLQEKTAKERRDRLARVAVEAGSAGMPVLFGGWFWATFTLAAGLAVTLLMLAKRAMYGRVVVRFAEAAGISLLLEVILGAGLHVHPSPIGLDGLRWAWSPWYLMPPAVVFGPVLVWGVRWAWKATADDGTFADDLRGSEQLPVEPREEKVTDESIVQAILASTARLPKDTHLTVIPPGVGWLAGKKLWTAEIDTGGPDAGPIIAARNDIASRLGLIRSRLLMEQSAKYGRHVTFTGIVGEPWGDPILSPLLDMERFRFGDPIPYAVDMLGQPWALPMFEMHYLIGGMPRKGKSTSCYPLYAAAALDPLAPIWGIDGGTVDTKVWDDAGLMRMWTTKPEEAVAVLDDVLAEIEMRQDLLAQAGLVRPNQEFYAEHNMSDGLLGFDEFASFTNHSDRKLAGLVTRKLVSILQRAPKTNIHVVLSTQSPSAKAFDTDGRGVIEGRGALLCDSPEMSDKILGARSSSRGMDASKDLDETVKGLMWMSVPGDTRIIRPYLIDAEKGQVKAIAQRAVDLRARPAAPGTAPVEVPELCLAVLRLLHQHEVTSMRTAEIVGRLRAAGHDLPDGISGQQRLAVEMRRVNVTPVMVRPDQNRSHYLAIDVEAAVHGGGVGEKAGLRLVKGSL